MTNDTDKRGLKITDGKGFSLSPMATSCLPPWPKLKKTLKADTKRISELTQLLEADGRKSLLIVLQGMDASGKDSTISSLFRYSSPSNIAVKSFKAPTAIEKKHDYLRRVHKACPPRGSIMVFNRSHYEDVLAAKVLGLYDQDIIKKRYEQINAFEHYLSQNDTVVLKFMLNISQQVQGERLIERLETPQKNWKLRPNDISDRGLWGEYMKAYGAVLRHTSAPHAPWHVIPSDSRLIRKAIIASYVRETLEDMDLSYPEVDLSKWEHLAKFKSSEPIDIKGFIENNC